ncbi:MAG: hypothetical protein LBH56_02870 [Coriobacteriales bacterium]|jgi:hypothetical protein|nr:hypothetical protein [Coriobacteriales bacterium]
MTRTSKRATSVPLLLSAILAAVLLLGGTIALMKTTDSVTNRIKIPQYRFDVSIVEVFDPPTDPIKPGDEPIEKRVSVTNNGDLPGFARLLILPTIIAADGYTVLPAHIGTEILANLNASEWADGGDGYYYYLGVLAPTETSPELFSTISLAANLDERYKGATFNIEVKCEAIGIKKWDYRVGWWGGPDAPDSADLIPIDKILRELAI